jgi:hypothetical protein
MHERMPCFNTQKIPLTNQICLENEGKASKIIHGVFILPMELPAGEQTFTCI